MIPRVTAEPGFRVVPGVFSSDEIARLADAFARAGICGAVRNTAANSGRTRAGARHLMHAAAVSAVAQDARMTELARQALGAEAFPFRATLFDKSLASNWLVAWHQDTALPMRERHDAPGWGPWSVKAGVLYAHAPASALERVVALRLHLDDSTSENGPLRVLPGTHTLGVLRDDEIGALVQRRAPAECTVAQGGVVVMHPLILHASSKSRGSAPRRVLHIEFADSLEIAPGICLAVA